MGTQDVQILLSSPRVPCAALVTRDWSRDDGTGDALGALFTPHLVAAPSASAALGG